MEDLRENVIKSLKKANGTPVDDLTKAISENGDPHNFDAIFEIVEEL